MLQLYSHHQTNQSGQHSPVLAKDPASATVMKYLAVKHSEVHLVRHTPSN